MNAEEFFWMINEIIQQNINAMSEADRNTLMESLEKDTDDTVLSFDLANNMEYC